jgi:hypothetical protein
MSWRIKCTATRAHRRPSGRRCSGCGRCSVMRWSRTLFTGWPRVWPGARRRGRVLRQLRKGLVREALEAYAAPLLSRSAFWQCSCCGTSWIWLSAAVGCSGDAGLLFRWLSKDMGAADMRQSRNYDGWWAAGNPRYLALCGSSTLSG